MPVPGDASIHESLAGGAQDAQALWLRERSRLLFGNADRLQVAAAVARAPSGVVHAQELGDALGITPSRVRAQLRTMVDAGVLELLGRVSNTVDYQRLEDPFWDAVRSLVDQWRGTWSARHPV